MNETQKANIVNNLKQVMQTLESVGINSDAVENSIGNLTDNWESKETYYKATIDGLQARNASQYTIIDTITKGLLNIDPKGSHIPRGPLTIIEDVADRLKNQAASIGQYQNEVELLDTVDDIFSDVRNVLSETLGDTFDNSLAIVDLIRMITGERDVALQQADIMQDTLETFQEKKRDFNKRAAELRAVITGGTIAYTDNLSNLTIVKDLMDRLGRQAASIRSLRNEVRALNVNSE